MSTLDERKSVAADELASLLRPYQGCEIELARNGGAEIRGSLIRADVEPVTVDDRQRSSFTSSFAGPHVTARPR